MLNDIKLRQYGGWTPGSKQPQRYVNYFANESSETLLEVYGIATRDKSSVELLSPKTCPNCNEGNTTDARFCAKCKMILTYDAYEETLQRQQEKELQIQKLQEKYEQDMKDLKQQVAENKRSHLGLAELVAGLRKELGVPPDKNVVWDWTKRGGVSVYDEEEYNSKHKTKGPVRYYHKP